MSVSLLLILCFPCLAVEDLTVDSPYPLTSPSELFPNIDRFKYIRSSSPLYILSAILMGELNIEREYNLHFDAAYSYGSFKHRFGVGRNTVSEILHTNQYYLYSNFLLSADSLSLQYHESDWHSLEKSLYGINACFAKKGRGYTTEFSTRFNRSDSLNDYCITSKYHRFYGYANMLSLESTFMQTPYLLDRKRSILVTLLDRFVYKDFFFVSPGIKAEFLSQTYFTPLLNIVYLATKHLSLSLSAEGQALRNDVRKPYQLPFLVRNDSLEAPINIFSASFESDVMIDTSFTTGVNVRMKKVKNPVLSFDHERYFLRRENLDTTIIFYDAAFHLLLSKTYFDITATFTAAYTPFYEDTIPYYPKYTYSICLCLKPLKQLTIGSELKGIGKMYSDQEGEIERHHIVSTSLEFSPSPYFSININSINTANWRGRFLNDIHYPGRIITSGVTIQF